ncbi:enoyl-CoA hydratase/isomerase family protein [Pseudoflavonifractor phocaeensis]|uniref:enoyl-CoA hydratase/isomerase family protein n=1 Tax=Pseudoflavonifractor phocaeensis TaxID=1870988 RepID=UPI00195A692D|nr:enoyl-CoA hydratase-related protein [Pseudoflavonifractor phocaeensis]MBM6869301.1 enoyl-CoA hydratase/isomerase family protein [Pseudoflavonifractor phocaeensis]MBM6937922.1 enoyl-CoA hydratase/isomerase family protein [Pseudoflavonifractor phocaeensis]
MKYDAQLVTVTTEHHIATLTLNDPPKMNALSIPMAQALTAALRQVWRDPEVRVVVLRGAGGKFCAGGDLTSMKRRVDAYREGREPESDTRANMWCLNQVILTIRDLPKPVIAWIEGAAAGGGMSLALACDFSLAEEEAKMVFAFAGIALAPDMGASVMAPPRIGFPRATELFMTGRRFSGREAAQWGLITAAYSAEELPGAVAVLARRLAAGPAQTYGEIKRRMNETVFSGLSAGMAQEVEGAARLTRTADHAEAVDAFLEKRRPVFHGR